MEFQELRLEHLFALPDWRPFVILGKMLPSAEIQSDLHYNRDNCSPSYIPMYSDPALFKMRKYNCVVFEYADKTYSASSCDCIGLFSDSDTPENSLTELKHLIEERILSGEGGVYLCTTPSSLQEKYFKKLEEFRWR